MGKWISGGVVWLVAGGWWQLPRIFGAVKLLGMMTELDFACHAQQ